MRKNKLSLGTSSCEPRTMLAASVFEPETDPAIGTNITTFVNETAGAANSEIASAWISAAKEAAAAGLSEVTFVIVRNVDSEGNLSGGPSIQSVARSVEAASSLGLDVTVFPLFETEDGWRGDYDPTGSTRDNFRSQYKELVTDLASIRGIDRLNFASEMDAMLENPDNLEFFRELNAGVNQELVENRYLGTRTGFATTLDSLERDEDANKAVAELPGVDFVGVSAYAPLFDDDEAELVAGTGPVSDRVFDTMVARWGNILDDVSEFGDEAGVNLLIQEFGAPAANYASLAPYSTDPGGVVSQDLPNLDAVDTNEQTALYESLLAATDGRGDEFEAIHFWTWENDVSQSPRTNGGRVDYPELFAISPDDGAAGELLADFLDSAETE